MNKPTYQIDYSGEGTGEFTWEKIKYSEIAGCNIKKTTVLGIVEREYGKGFYFKPYELMIPGGSRKPIHFETVQEAVEYGKKYFGITN